MSPSVLAWLYLTCKAVHIIFFVAWFAAMFYIWRLFVYHAETDSEEVRGTLEIMERKLYRIIMVPASVVTLVFGLATFAIRWDGLAPMAWIWIKLVLVGGLFVLQFMAGEYRRRLAEGASYSGRLFRILNEVPTLLLVAIVLLAVFKPF